MYVCVYVRVCVCVCVCARVCVGLQHDLDPSAKGLPPLMRCTGQKLQDSGLYVLGKVWSSLRLVTPLT